MAIVIPPLKLLVFGIVVTFLSQFNLAIQYTIINVPEQLLKQFINSSFSEQFGDTLSDAVLDSLWGAFSSLFPVGLVIGCPLLSPLADKVGRRFALFIVPNVMVLIGCAVIFMAKYLRIWELLFLARFIFGAASGLSAAVLPVYLMECSLLQCRGFLASIRGFFGYFISGLGIIVGLPQLLGTANLWPFCLSFQGLVAVVQLLSTPLFPESPAYDYIRRNRKQEAQRTLGWLYDRPGSIDGLETIDEVLNRFETEKTMCEEHQLGVKELIRVPELRLACFLAIAIGVSRPLSGLAVVETYSVQMLEDVGISQGLGNYVSLALQMGAALISIGVIVLVDHYGRRPLLLYTIAASIAVWSLLTVFQCVSVYAHARWTTWVSIVLYLSFMLIHPVGSNMVSWFVAAELVPQNARVTVNTLSLFSSMPFAMLTLFGYEVLNKKVGPFSPIILFAGPLTPLFVFLYTKLPETKQRPIEDIVAELRGGPRRNSEASLISDSYLTNYE